MKRSDVKDLINQELENMTNGRDDEFVPPDSTPRFIESKERMSEEEAIIDELLMSVPRSQGYYLKLSKETRPNEYEFKLRVDNYENWSDLEYEIASIVKAYTAKAPNKWGSGHYRVTIWRDGGIRGPKHKPIDFCIDAQEQELGIGTGNSNNVVGNQNVDVETQINSLSNLVTSVQKIIPQQEQLSPAEVQKMINDAYMQGMNSANQKVADSGNSNTALITGMFGLLGSILQNQNGKVIEAPIPIDPIKSLSEMMSIVNGMNQSKEKPKSFVEQLQEMQALGLVKQPKDENPLAKIAEMKDLLSLVSDLSGVSKGERPSTIEKIIDVVGPHVPEMISKVTGTINNAIDYSKARMGLPTNNPPTRIVRNVNQQALPTNQSTSEDPNMLFYGKLFTELHQIISANDHSKFPYIANQIVKLFGSEQAVLDIISGTLSPDAIANALTMYGGVKFRDTTFVPQMNTYITEFTNWVKAQHAQHVKQQQQQLDNNYVVLCSKCGAEFEYQSKAEFDSDPNKVCGVDLSNGIVCDGLIVAPKTNGNVNPIVEQPLAGPYDSGDDIAEDGTPY